MTTRPPVFVKLIASMDPNQPVLDVKRKSQDEVAYRQGGRGGMWVHCTLDELATAMNDGNGEWLLM